MNIKLSTKQNIYRLVTMTAIALTIYFLGRVDNTQVETKSIANVAKIQQQSSVLPQEKIPSSVPAAVIALNTKQNDCDSQANAAACKKAQVPAATVMTDKKTLTEENRAWKIGDSKSPISSIPLSEKIVAFEPIEIKPYPENFPQVGEQIELPMLNGQTVAVDVQSVSTNPNGDQSWSGHLPGHGTDYPVIMTYGENSIFAMITTPEGSYSMESVNGAGWLYKNPSELELSTAGTKDYLEVVGIH